MLQIKNSKLYNTKNRELDSYIVFFDWKSAFDLVDHDILLSKLELTGISNRSIRIVKILLYACRASLDGTRFFQIQKGVPQGSIIAPYLYIIFYGDLIRHLE